MSDTIPYPHYGAPAQFIERSWPHSSDGPHAAPQDWLSEQALVHPADRHSPPTAAHTPEPDRVRLANSPDPALAAVQTSSIEARYLDTKAKGDADVPALWHR